MIILLYYNTPLLFHSCNRLILASESLRILDLAYNYSTIGVDYKNIKNNYISLNFILYLI